MIATNYWGLKVRFYIKHIMWGTLCDGSYYYSTLQMSCMSLDNLPKIRSEWWQTEMYIQICLQSLNNIPAIVMQEFNYFKREREKCVYLCVSSVYLSVCVKKDGSEMLR